MRLDASVSSLLAVPAALLLYVIALLAGMYLPRLLHRRRGRRRKNGRRSDDGGTVQP